MINLRSRFVRLALVMTILPAMIMVIVGLMAVHKFDAQLESELKNQINDEVASLVEIHTEQGRIGLTNSIQMRIKMTPSQRSESYYKLTDLSGKLLVGNMSTNLPNGTSEVLTRVRTTELKGGEILSVGRSLGEKNKSINWLRSLFQKAVLFSIAMGLFIGAISAWLFKRRLHEN